MELNDLCILAFPYSGVLKPSFLSKEWSEALLQKVSDNFPPIILFFNACHNRNWVTEVLVFSGSGDFSRAC